MLGSRIHNFVIAIGAFLLIGCSPAEISSIETASGKPYFPKSEFSDLPSYDNITVPYFEAHLAAMKEPVLWERDDIEFAIRVSWFSSFSGDATIRIEKHKGKKAVALFKRYRVERSEESVVAVKSVRLIAKDEHELSDDDISKLRKTLIELNFFSLNNKQDYAATDGTDWLIEVAIGSKYHAVYRATPNHGSVFDIGRLVEGLAKTVVDIEK